MDWTAAAEEAYKNGFDAGVKWANGTEVSNGIGIMQDMPEAGCCTDRRPETVSKRAEILRAAERAVCGKREQDYGSPEDNFALIGLLWTAYLGTVVEAADVAHMMCLFKIGRLKTGTATEDSYIDLAGYAACGAEIAMRGKEAGHAASEKV